MKLLEAKKMIQEHDSWQSSIDDANRDMKALDTDLKQIKKTRDGNKADTGLFGYHNARVILIRQQIKYWKKYVEEAKSKMKILMEQFEI